MDEKQIRKEIGKGPISICARYESIIPAELLKIQNIWRAKSDSFKGNDGTCVLGAGFEFKYQDKKYFMPPRSRYQGCLSWETSKYEIEELLKSAGATNIIYHWGRMD